MGGGRSLLTLRARRARLSHRVAGKRVVAAPVFSPYQASFPPAALKAQLAGQLVSRPAGVASNALGDGLRLPDLEILEPFDIHTVGSRTGGDPRLKSRLFYSAEAKEVYALHKTTVEPFQGQLKSGVDPI